jgi:hypothetical protein
MMWVAPIWHAHPRAELCRQAQEGRQTKVESMYAYLTGPSFRHRIDAMVACSRRTSRSSCTSAVRVERASGSTDPELKAQPGRQSGAEGAPCHGYARRFAYRRDISTRT